MTGVQKLLLIVFVITIAVSIFFYYTQGAGTAIVVSLLVFVFLSITSAVWRTNRSGNVQVRIISLGLASATVFSFGFWQQFVENGIQFFINKYIPAFKDYPIQSVAPGLVLAFVLVVIFIVNYFNRDSTAMGVHPNRITEDIPERSFSDRLKGVCIALLDDLKSIDKSTNWSTQFFTPLDAEVEVYTNNKTHKITTDLLNAIKKSKARLFLVLGDPGSGKSVALRKLCQDLLHESDQTGKIPVYINLKEWIIDKRWDANNPPTVNQIQQFVIENLKSRDIVTSRFFEDYYDKLYEAGRLYFVLDSFDEIPSVLEESENSELIQQLSRVVFKFLKGARSEDSQGILASRNFRKPTKEFQVDTTLTIRPFSEKSIIKSFKLRGRHEEAFLKTLFKDYPELVPVARNPFSATLIAEYAENNENNLPATQSEMYSSYINRTLTDCQHKIKQSRITIQDVITCTILIAKEMFNKYGLEVRIEKLREEFPQKNIDSVVSVLKFARLGRGSSSDDNTFSFAHRRFAEYFYVQSMLIDDQFIRLHDIPTDSQQRDALVLYCEVADAEKARYIADFCWNTIKTLNDPQDIRTIHCMRFLRDAFKVRNKCIGHITTDLAQYILKQIHTTNNVITIKLALETVGLLDKKYIEKILTQALEIGNYWTNETAFKSCRYLSEIPETLKSKIYSYIDEIPLLSFISQSREILFFLSISKAFKSIHTRAIVKLIDCYCLITLLISLFIATLIYRPIGYILLPITIMGIAGFMLEYFKHRSIHRVDTNAIRELVSFAMVTGTFLLYSAVNREKIPYFSSLEISNRIYILSLICSLLVYPIYKINNIANFMKEIYASFKDELDIREAIKNISLSKTIEEFTTVIILFLSVASPILLIFLLSRIEIIGTIFKILIPALSGIVVTIVIIKSIKVYTNQTIERLKITNHNYMLFTSRTEVYNYYKKNKIREQQNYIHQTTRSKYKQNQRRMA